MANLLFITADQWRGECLSTLGHPTVKTPNLDELAADGVLFRNHFAQTAPCGPSRACLYTGMYLHRHRSYQNGIPLDARHTNIALEARRLGYRPTLAGYTDTSHDPRTLHPRDPLLTSYEEVLPGFTEVLANPHINRPHDWARWLKQRGRKLPDHLSDLYYQRVDNYPGTGQRGDTYAPAAHYTRQESDSAFLTEKALEFFHLPKSRPWFLHLSYLAPHPPYIGPEPFNKMYHPDDVPDLHQAASAQKEGQQHPFLDLVLKLQFSSGSDGEEPYPRDNLSKRQLRATYYGLMSHVDDNIGRLIRGLKQSGQYENTIIVFGSDHGDQLWDHHLVGKGGYFDASYQIPLIIRAPGDTARRCTGTVVDAFTENVDIMPTLLDLLGGEIPLQCDGRSLRPFLQGELPENWRNEVHWEVDFRYLDNFPECFPNQELGIDVAACKFTVIRDHRYKYVHFADLPPLFLDLQDDPHELNDRAADPAYANLMLEYCQKMLSWRMQHDESTLSDIVLGPDGPMPLESRNDRRDS